MYKRQPVTVVRYPDILQCLDEKVHAYVSVESGSESQRRRLGRLATSVSEDVDAVVRVAQRGCRVESGFILVDPLSTREEVLQSLEVIEKLLELGVTVWAQGYLRIPFWRVEYFRKRGIECELDRSLDGTVFTFTPQDESLGEVVNYLRKVSSAFQVSKHAFREGKDVKRWIQGIVCEIRKILG